MAMDILARYGIKEVADVTFYKIKENGEPGAPVLYLDTLKVSTIEQTAENSSARGGKGNPELIMWDYGKEITVTLEDALFSAKSMALMYGVDIDNVEDFAGEESVLKTVKPSQVTGEDTALKFIINGQEFEATNVKYYGPDGSENYLKAPEDGEGEPVSTPHTKDTATYITGDIKVTGQKIVISSDKFPGTYYVTGDTYARSETTGEDEFFQFIIPKAKMQSEVTLTMEAEGDPSTFNMNLKVLRPDDGDMMKLVKYSVPKAAG